MRCVRFGIIIFFLAFLFFCLQDARAQESLAQQSLTIRDSLVSIREQSRALSEELANVRERLTVSETERTELREKSTALSASLTSISGQLNDSYRNITDLETKLRISIKVTVTLSAVLLALILLKIAGYVLYFRGVRVPRWLDILL